MNKAKEKYDKALKEMREDSPDIPMVLELLNASMEEGSTEATYALATWYLHGENVEKDLNKAIFLLKMASYNKHPDALYDLAVCYENGEGIKKDERKAFDLYLHAALRGENQSVYEVGRCYYYGIGMPENKDLSDIWFERAEELGVD